MQDCVQQKNLSPTPIFILIGIVAIGFLLAFHDSRVSSNNELDWLSHLARSGDAGAQMQLGLAYRDGRYGLEVDPHTGLYWLTAAAKNGNAYAADAVATAYANGEGTQPNAQQAERWWNIAASEGNANAEQHLASQLLANGNTAQGIDWLRSAADRGDNTAHAMLVELYRGNDVTDTDLHRGENPLDALGERIDSVGLRTLFATWHTYKVSSPYMHSADALLAQAKAGDPEAEYELALRYRDGSWAVAKDQKESTTWLKRSAAAGNRFAIKELTASHFGQANIHETTGANKHL
jgi:uncharacterized protein